MTATPFSVDANHFIMVAIEDFGQPKRLAVLQRIFFHDVEHGWLSARLRLLPLMRYPRTRMCIDV